MHTHFESVCVCVCVFGKTTSTSRIVKFSICCFKFIPVLTVTALMPTISRIVCVGAVKWDTSLTFCGRSSSFSIVYGKHNEWWLCHNEFVWAPMNCLKASTSRRFNRTIQAYDSFLLSNHNFTGRIDLENRCSYMIDTRFVWIKKKLNNKKSTEFTRTF